MRSWVAVRQALSGMDIVMRAWARQLKLDGCEVMAVMLLAQRTGQSASEVALFSGRARQHAQRTLCELGRRGFVERLRVSPSGKVMAWSLTPAGEALARRLEVRLLAWEEILASRVDLPEVLASLERMTESLVNRPSADGWARGLMIPQEARRDSQWDLPGELRTASHPAGVSGRIPIGDKPEDEAPPASKRARDQAALAATWDALWR